MQVALDFSLYMMRFGAARLAAYFASAGRPTDRQEISKRIDGHFRRAHYLSAADIDRFGAYLKGKPGSRRYTPLRRQLGRGIPLAVDMQDYWLSDPKLPSSVGALTAKYLDDPFKLCHLLKLTKTNNNVLLSRGKLSRYDPAVDPENPFFLPVKQQLYLGFWLLDVDRDWIWAFLVTLKDHNHAVINLDNRVEILLKATQRLLQSRALRSGGGSYITTRRRLQKLVANTQRNVRERLNLGQPWSWFLIPRLELLVDAGIISKSQPDQLTGYSLTEVGLVLQAVAARSHSGDELLDALVRGHGCTGSQAELPPTWEDVADALDTLPPDFRSVTGYYPLFETAVAICVERCTGRVPRPGWAVSQVIETILSAGGKSGEVALGISRRGRPSSFKVRA